jgi:hypothetical protein
MLNVLVTNACLSQENLKMFQYDKRSLFNDYIADNFDNDTIQKKKIVIDGFDSKIPFYHFSQINSTSNSFVFLLHGANGSKDSWLEYNIIQDSLAKIGYHACSYTRCKISW